MSEILPGSRLADDYIWPWSGTWNFLWRARTEISLLFVLISLLKQERWWDYLTTTVSPRTQRLLLSRFPWRESVWFIISPSNIHMDMMKSSVPLLLRGVCILKFYLKFYMKLSIKHHLFLNTFYLSISECIFHIYKCVLWFSTCTQDCIYYSF